MTTAFGARLVAQYETFFADPLFRAFVGDSGYANFGYWHDDTRSGAEACDNLVDRLLAHAGAAPQRVLDVACGHGGTTRRLAKRFGADRVLAINLAQDQLRAAAARVPGARFARMDAARLAVADASVDVLLCVEAAFHFETRADFLREAQRVLRPGGHLLLADILARSGAGRIPRANLVRTRDDYAALLQRAGFVDVAVEDVTQRTWKTFRRRYARFAARRQGLPAVLRALPRWPWLLWRYLITEHAMTAYVLATARRSDSNGTP